MREDLAEQKREQEELDAWHADNGAPAGGKAGNRGGPSVGTSGFVAGTTLIAREEARLQKVRERNLREQRQLEEYEAKLAAEAERQTRELYEEEQRRQRQAEETEERRRQAEEKRRLAEITRAEKQRAREREMRAEHARQLEREVKAAGKAHEREHEARKQRVARESKLKARQDAQRRKTEAIERDLRQRHENKMREMERVERERQRKLKAEQDEAARVKIEDLYQELNEFREERLKLAANLEKLFRLKQGQVEVEQEAVVTDYADAVLLNRTIIEALNKKIRELGGDKVKVLEEVKDQRKAIHLLDWENQKFHMQGEDLQQKMRDFQLLRVTKSLQELIKGGGKHKHAAEIAMLEKKSEHSKKVHEEKVNERKGKLAKLKKLIREKEADNRKLDEHIANLEVSVSERSNIYELQTHTATGGIQNAPYDRFKDIVRQRKLLDLAKAQTEEIEFLRDELERLKQRTFPSFAVAQGPGPVHPDEQM